MKRFGWIFLFAVAALPTTAAAQGASYVSDTEAFVKAVADRDGSKALDLLRQRGKAVINSRNAKGATALIVAIEARDDTWTRFLLQEGADPNYAAKDGETPLIAAARMGYADAVEWLLAKGAKVDGTNRMGETSLIVAVQQRHLPIVKLLLGKGANPDKTDNAAGYSARDYAKRDSRAREILALLDAGPGKKAEQLDDFKLE